MVLYPGSAYGWLRPTDFGLPEPDMLTVSKTHLLNTGKTEKTTKYTSSS